MNNFKQILALLNQAQRQAVEQIEGPVMVVAGPGTGKTQVLSARIAQILQETDTQPHSILALTFTDAAASTMRERLASMIGSSAYGVRIQTFHSFCDNVLREHPDYFDLTLNAEPLSELEQLEFLRNFLQTEDLQFLRTAKSAFHLLPAISSALQNIKREGLSVEQYEDLVKSEESFFEKEKEKLKKTQLEKQKRELGRMRELARLYSEYQDYLSSHERYDYEDMLLSVIRGFGKHESLLREYQEEIHYFLVDEYQDTNAAQNKILDILASYWGAQANVFVVGDPNQTIYRFQGASFENVLGFLERYPKSTLISLEKGYRCPQDVYTIASKVLEGQAVPDQTPELWSLLKRPLESQTDVHEPSITVANFSTDSVERLQIAQQIKQLLKNGTNPEDIAILCKKNAQLELFIETLQQFDIPYSLEKRENILQQPFIQQIVLLLKIIFAIQTGEEIYDLHTLLLSDLFTIKESVIFKAIYEASKLDQTLYRAIDEKSVEPLQEAKSQLESLAKQATVLPLSEFFATACEQLEINKTILEKKDRLQAELLRSFFDEMKVFEKKEKSLDLARFVEILNSLESERVGIRLEILYGEREGVVLSTAHGAKGKEWDYVFIPNLADKVWGNARRPFSIKLPSKILRFQSETKQDKNEDDRRLFYVAISRARQQLFLSYPGVDEINGKKQVASSFLTEISETDLLRKWQELEISKETELQALLPLAPKRNFDNDFTSFLQQLTADFVLSATALNSYLRDPDQFFLQYLLKLPTASSSALAFGSAIHGALEFFTRHAVKTNTRLEFSQIFSRFHDLLDKEPLAADELRRLSEYGKKVLEEYFEKKDFDSNIVLAVEQRFGGKSQPVLLDKKYPLVGKIDRIDWLDKSKKIVSLVDYKTGRVRSINDVLGKTKAGQKDLSERERALPESIRTPLQRQLLFYALLAELDLRFSKRVKVERLELEFVESYHKGGKPIVSLPVDREGVGELRKLIGEVMREVRELNA